jgi:orotidine-5'-phosphate decarboxylase
MNYTQLVNLIKQRKSFLCVGLDPDPKLVEVDKILDFNKRIIDLTSEWSVAYKPNIAFYEHLGPKGWNILDETRKYIGSSHFTIADAKRGDIGNTSNFYAKTFFDTYNFDSITLSPYMGEDSIKPFLDYPDKWSIVLALTSNSGSLDFQVPQLYKRVLERSKSWGTKDNMMWVIGATRSELLHEVRQIIPDHFLLVPGVGNQGGSLEEVCRWGMNSNCGLLVNSSRGIIYSDNPDLESKKIQQEMQNWLEAFAII